ncbi:hypothetical protein D9M69_620930 [compost metagenome]
MRRQHVADGVQGAFRLAFLDEADDGIDDHRRQQHGRVDPVPQQRRNDGRAHHHVKQDVVELAQEAPQCALTPRLHQAVRPVTGQPVLGLALGQTRRAGL